VLRVIQRAVLAVEKLLEEPSMSDRSKGRSQAKK